MTEDANQKNPLSSQNNVLDFQQLNTIKVTQDVPVVYADAVVNHVMGPGVAKFNLLRNDSILGALNEYQKVAVVQIVMPAQGFADMVAFFEHRLRLMVKAGHLTQDAVDERRAFYGQYPDA